MADILLLQPPISFTNHLANSGLDTYPIGLCYITAVLKKDGFSVRAINNSDAAYSISSLLDIIEAENVKILGVSTLLATIPSTVKLAKAVKDRFSDRIHVLMGNAYPSIDPEIIKRYPFFDAAVVGEAEGFVSEHCQSVLSGKKVTGIVTGNYPENLDAIPFPAYSSMENTIYHRGHLIPIIGTRGCPFQCGYCARQALSKKVRSRSSANIIAEMKERLHFTSAFYFQDDSATIDRKHVIDMCNAIIEEEMNVVFEMTTRLDLLDEEMIVSLKRAGCQRLIIGIESGNERIRNEIIRKNLSDDKIFKGMELTKKCSMPVQLMFMLGHPEETPKEIMDSVNFPLKLDRMGFGNIEMVGYHLTIPIPGTRYFEWGIKNGIVSPSVLDDYINGKLGDGYFGHWPYLIPSGLTYHDMLEYRRLATQSFHLRFKYILKRAWMGVRSPKILWQDIKHGYYVIKQGTSSDISKTES